MRRRMNTVLASDLEEHSGVAHKVGDGAAGSGAAVVVVVLFACPFVTWWLVALLFCNSLCPYSHHRRS
jgi:hypothetical protein